MKGEEIFEINKSFVHEFEKRQTKRNRNTERVMNTYITATVVNGVPKLTMPNANQSCAIQ